MCDSEAEKILFILNKHERAYRRLIPVYIFLAIVLWILPILLIVYLYFCIVDNEFLRIGFCIAWTAYYFLSLFKYFVKYFFPLDREDLLNLMDLAKDSPDAKQELLERLLSGKRMTGRDEMDIKRILKTKEALDNIRNFIDKQQLTNSDTPKKSTVPNEDKKGISGFAPIFPDICYHLTHYKPAAADIPVASDNPAHYADAIRYNARTPLQGSLLPLTRLVWA